MPTTNQGVEFFLDPDDEVRFQGRQWSLGSHGYVQTWENNRHALLHRVILGLVPGDGLIGDHEDGDPMNNRRANLRAVDASRSSANVSARGSSGYRGVYPNRGGTWMARGKVKGELHFLGSYATVEEAAEVAHRWRVLNLPGYIDRPAARRVLTH